MRVQVYRSLSSLFWLCLLFIGAPVSAGLIWLWDRVTGHLPGRAAGGTLIAVGIVAAWGVSVALHIRRLHTGGR